MALTKISNKVISNSSITTNKISNSLIFYENNTTISSDYTVASGRNAMSAGPLSINANVTILGDWVIV